MRDMPEHEPRASGLLHTAARVLIASFFIGKAVGLVADPNGMGQYLIIGQAQSYLMWPNIAFEFLAAFSIMIGLQTRLSSALLALYLFWSSFVLNYAPGNVEAISEFWRDLALIGGLMLLISHGRGAYAVDNYLNRRAKEGRAKAIAIPEGEEIEFARFEPYPAR